MDLGTHIATGLALSTFFDEPGSKAACVVGAVAADLTLTPTYIHRLRVAKAHRTISALVHLRKIKPTSYVMKVYYFFHSLIFALFLFVLALLGFGE